MDLLQRRRELLMMGGGVPYQKVEYLQCNGMQYIDTLIVPKDTPRAVVVWEPTANFDGDIFGFANNTQPSFIGDVTQRDGGLYIGYYRYYSTSSIGYVTVLTVPWYSIHTSDWGIEQKQDGIVYKTMNRQSFAANTQSIRLFKGRNNRTTIKMYSAKIYDGDTLKGDFVPVRIGQVGYMYDKVSGQLFGNAGTGNFILGNDI